MSRSMQRHDYIIGGQSSRPLSIPSVAATEKYAGGMVFLFVCGEIAVLTLTLSVDVLTTFPPAVNKTLCYQRATLYGHIIGDKSIIKVVGDWFAFWGWGWWVGAGWGFIVLLGLELPFRGRLFVRPLGAIRRQGQSHKTATV